MRTDMNPSVLFMAYTTEKADKLFREELKKRGMQMRELKLFDVEIPMDKYDESVNWFKEFICKQNERLIDGLTGNMFVKPFINKLQDKTGYSLMKPKWDWEAHKRHPLKFLLLFPIACEQKYSHETISKKETKNYKKLLTFESKGYKAPTLKEQGIFEEKDMEMIEDDN